MDGIVLGGMERVKANSYLKSNACLLVVSALEAEPLGMESEDGDVMERKPQKRGVAPGQGAGGKPA